MSSLTSLRGGEPLGLGITGLVLVSSSALRRADGLGSSVVFAVVSVLFAVDSPSSSLPQATGTSVSSRSRQGSRRRIGGGSLTYALQDWALAQTSAILPLRFLSTTRSNDGWARRSASIWARPTRAWPSSRAASRP